MIYETFDAADGAAQRFKESHPDAVDVRVEKVGGGYRAVFDHYASVGRQSACKTFVLSKTLIAQWKARIQADHWDSLDRDLTELEARSIRDELEAQLPKRWRFRENWFDGGKIYVVLEGKKTLVTSHCEG